MNMKLETREQYISNTNETLKWKFTIYSHTKQIEHFRDLKSYRKYSLITKWLI